MNDRFERSSLPEAERHRLVDFVLGELPPDEAHAVAERVARDPGTAAERDRVRLAVAAIREAAATGWEAGSGGRGGRLRRLGPALATAAAVLVAALLLLQRNGAPLHPTTVYEPDGAFGYLLPEEVDADGRMRAQAPGSGPAEASYVLRRGAATVTAVGGRREFALTPGDAIADESRVQTPADGGAWVGLPGGGHLFLGPLTEVRLRRHQDGGAALRLAAGVVAVAADARPVRIAVDESALLLRLREGAGLFRHTPVGEALCLRGTLVQRLGGEEEFPIPPGERLLAACAKEPWTEPYVFDDLDLDWYRALAYEGEGDGRSEAVAWAAPGRSHPLETTDTTLVFLRLQPADSGRVEVSFGAEPRVFARREGMTLKLRLRLHDLGPGPTLEIAPPAAAAALRAARLLDPGR